MLDHLFIPIASRLSENVKGVYLFKIISNFNPNCLQIKWKCERLLIYLIPLVISITIVSRLSENESLWMNLRPLVISFSIASR